MNPSAAPISSFSTTSASSPSTPAPVTICSKSSKSGMDADRRSSPHSSRCPPGTRSSATPLTPTPFWTASCTTRIASNSQARACAAPEANNPKLLDLRPRKGKKLSRPTSAAPRAGSSRYRGAASSRNPWAQSSRYRRAASPESADIRVLEKAVNLIMSGRISQIRRLCGMAVLPEGAEKRRIRHTRSRRSRYNAGFSIKTSGRRRFIKLGVLSQMTCPSLSH